MRDTNFLTSSAKINPAFPIEPVRTRLRRAIRPTMSGIEFGNESEPAITCGVDLSGQECDLSFEFADGASENRIRNASVHMNLRYCVYTQYNGNVASRPNKS